MLRKAILWGTSIFIALVAASYAAVELSPWPAALFLRRVMDNGGVAAAKALEKHVPDGVAAKLNQQYDAGNPDALLDVYFPADIKNALPTIVWIHGGGFLSGTKDHVANYLKILAAKGYTVVGVNYSLAPRATYPTPIRQVNAALAYLRDHAGSLHIDPARIFLAGDSAGAQIAGQTANIVTSPAYAKVVGIVPSIARAQLRGVILHCGMFDPHSLDLDGPFGGYHRTVGWSYFGVRDFLKDPRMAQFSVVRNVTADFPPMFISVGNADRLAPHSKLLAETAAKLGVPVDSLFFPDDYQPPLRHEYQFDLDTAAGRLALERTLAFLAARSQ
jgi:acetyl esterase/lipase